MQGRAVQTWERLGSVIPFESGPTPMGPPPIYARDRSIASWFLGECEANTVKHVSVFWPHEPPDARELNQLVYFPALTELELYLFELPLQSLPPEIVMQRLTVMCIDFGGEARFPARDWRSLSKASNLRELRLMGPGVTDAIAKPLERLTNLRILILEDAQITDLCVQSLALMTGLRELLLDGTRVTDQSVEALGRLSNLRILGLGDTAITASGFARLRALLPSATIYEEK